MKLIGTGAFSKVYHNDNEKHVHIKSDDYVKECMAMGWFPNARCFPKVKESTEHGYDYMMTYYPKHTSLKKSLKPAEWAKYQELRRIFDEYAYDSEADYFTWRKAFKTIKNRTLRKHMLEALDSLADYGQDIKFEISPRNVAVSPARNLILLDVFFFRSQLQEVRGKHGRA